MPDVFREKIDLHPGGGAVRQHVALVLTIERPVIRGFGHPRQHRRIDIIREDPLQLKMIERRLARARTIDRCHDEVAQTRDGSSAIRAPEFNALIHIRLELPYLMRTERSTIRNALAVFCHPLCTAPVPQPNAPDQPANLPATCATSTNAARWPCAAFIEHERCGCGHQAMSGPAAVCTMRG